ncbi:hypothetical protein LTR95_007146 [Oleoguttula sp. CCFEE 5521]
MLTAELDSGATDARPLTVEAMEKYVRHVTAQALAFTKLIDYVVQRRLNLLPSTHRIETLEGAHHQASQAMADAQSIRTDRCFILELPPEMRLEIYSHVDFGSPCYELEQRVVLDRHGQARVINKSKPSPLLQTCRIIRAEWQGVAHRVVLNELTIDGEQLKVGRGTTECLRLSHYDQLEVLGGSKHLKTMPWIILSITSPGKTGAATARQVLAAVNAVIQFINGATKLRKLGLFVKIERKQLLDDVCRALAGVRCPEMIRMNLPWEKRAQHHRKDQRARVRRLASELGLCVTPSIPQCEYSLTCRSTHCTGRPHART